MNVQKTKESFKPQKGVVTGSCEPFDLGPGKLILVLWKNREFSNF